MLKFPFSKFSEINNSHLIIFSSFCYTTVHTKQTNISQLEYSRNFEATTKESVKRIIHWGAYYHTSRKSLYPKPDESIPLPKVPMIKHLSPVKLPANECEIKQNWATSYGDAVRQRTVLQETMMAKQGSLPEYMYQRELIATNRVNVVFEEEEQEKHKDKEQERVTNSNINSSKRTYNTTDDYIEEGNDTDDRMDEFDESSNEEVDMTGDENEAERQTRTEVVTKYELGRLTISFLGLIRDMEE